MDAEVLDNIAVFWHLKIYAKRNFMQLYENYPNVEYHTPGPWNCITLKHYCFPKARN